MRAKSLLFLLAFLFSFATLRAQRVLTLEECLNLAVENNLQVRQSQNSVLATESTLKQSKQAFYPSVNGNMSNTYDFGNVLDNFSFSTTSQRVSFFTSLQARMDLFQGFQKWNALKKSRMDVQSAVFQLEDLKNDIMTSTSLFYFALLFDKENLKIAENRQDLVQKQLELMQKRLDAGLVTQGDVYAIQAQLSTEKLTLINAQNQYNRDLLQLLQFLNLDITEEYEIQSPDVEAFKENEDLPQVEGIFEYAMINMPGLKAREYQILSNELSLKNARANYYPTLSVTGNLQSWYTSTSRREIDPDPTPTPDSLSFITLPGVVDETGQSTSTVAPDVFTPIIDLFGLDGGAASPTEIVPFFTQLSGNFTQSLTLNLTIPIYNNRQVKTSVEQTQINLENARLSYEIEKQTLTQEIQQAYLDVMAAKAKHDAAEEQLVSLSEFFNYSQSKFDSGLIDFYSYLETLNNKTRAELELVQAKYDYILKLKVLDLYQGKPIKF